MEKSAERPPALREGAGDPSESVIRATFSALVAEKKRAKKHYEQGNLHFAAGEFEEALSEFRKALGLSPRDPEYRKRVRAAEQALGRSSTR